MYQNNIIFVFDGFLSIKIVFFKSLTALTAGKRTDRERKERNENSEWKNHLNNIFITFETD